MSSEMDFSPSPFDGQPWGEGGIPTVTNADRIAIRVENLSKCYQIYHQPRDRLKQFVLPRLRRLVGLPPKEYYREFWALKDVSFEVKRGETIGIIGRNGSGKSTLLQMICGTLSPTNGNISTHGRIAALLELGSGFNPEFTGRENVYMNALVLGLNKDEIDARFDEIALFTDIGEFIEQPVKTYSSGMLVRLAFAVAVHVQPDILVVDEALSVGDIAFRNKCMDVIQRMIARGVTILFVTHDLGTLQLICSRVLWLSNGELRASGNPIELSQDYYVSTLPDRHFSNGMHDQLPPQQETGKARFEKVSLHGNDEGPVMLGRPLRIGFTIRAFEALPRIVFAVSIYSKDGNWLIGQTSLDMNVVWSELPAGGSCSGSWDMKSLCLGPGEYLVALAAYDVDYTRCFALTDLCLNFSVRAPFPTWGKFYHPGVWCIGDSR